MAVVVFVGFGTSFLGDGVGCLCLGVVRLVPRPYIDEGDEGTRFGRRRPGRGGTRLGRGDEVGLS